MPDPTVSKLPETGNIWWFSTHIPIFRHFRRHLPCKHDNWSYLAEGSCTAVSSRHTQTNKCLYESLLFSLVNAVRLYSRAIHPTSPPILLMSRNLVNKSSILQRRRKSVASNARLGGRNSLDRTGQK